MSALQSFACAPTRPALHSQLANPNGIDGQRQLCCEKCEKRLNQRKVGERHVRIELQAFLSAPKGSKDCMNTLIAHRM
eukprot:scaffold9796_cov154-Ochromonas_danica.AAC.9